MAFIKVTQMIEKERQTVAPRDFWRCAREKQNKDKFDDSLVFDNCLTENVLSISSSDQVSNTWNESTELDKAFKHDDNLMKDLEEDSDNIVSENISRDDLDATDYFDSEDEYWDSLRNKDIKEDLCPHFRFYHLPHSVKDIVSNACHSLEAYDRSPDFTPAVQKFAEENSFEIHDVYGDKNCLFRAVADQFMINGCPGHTEVSLRDTAIDRLRLDPSKYDVIESTFLPGEPWEEYIKKMDRTKEWGVNTILQALADVFLLQINIFNFVHSDIRPSNITIKSTENVVPKPFHIFLGFVGDFHTFSLRPLQWMSELPYKAQIFRLLVTCTDKNLDERRNIVDRKLALLSQGHIPESQLAKHVQFVLHCISLEDKRKQGQPFEKSHFELIFKSYSGGDLEPEESIEIRNRLVSNHSQFDPLSGIPLPYLSFVIKLIFPFKHFEGQYCRHHLLESGEVIFHYLGSCADQSSFTLRDISRTKRMSKLQFRRKRSIPRNRVVVIKRDKRATYGKDSIRECPDHAHVIIDSTDSHPGYCKLRLSPSFSSDTEVNVFQTGANRYLKAFRITDRLRTQLEAVHLGKVECIGVPCYTFPFFQRWVESKKDHFPSREVITLIVREGCTLIPKAHPKSKCQDIEWQLNFSMGEHLLFKSLTVAQKHGFFVLKVLLDNMVHHVPFKTKHLKSVFLMACEKLPSGAWETNISGCVLYVLDLLLSCLKAKFLPNYFIPENNLIDCHRDEDINTLCVIVEYIRLFPASVIQFVAEKHGYTFGPNLIKNVLSKIQYFTDRHMQRAFNEMFGPLTIATAKIMAKMGLYDISFDILEELFEQSLLIPQTGLRQTSLSFFDLFISALMEMKQKASRVILAQTFDMKMGSNLSEMVLEKERGSLQTYLPWIIDKRIGWVEVSNESNSDLSTIANFLYEFSKREYGRQNSVLAELSITTAIQCIQEVLKEDNVEGEKTKNIGLETDVEARKQMLKRKLISFYMHVYRISELDHLQHPLIEHMDEIEKLCREFPEMTGEVCSMFSFLGQKAKRQEYAQKFYHLYGTDITFINMET